MFWMILWIPLGFLAAVIALRMIGASYYQNYVAWESKNRHGLAYYGKPLAERQAFKEKIRRRARFLLPLIWLEMKVQKKHLPVLSIEYQNIRGPRGTCTSESFEAARRYQPTAQDIFVVTQMKCGTTWMQQIVYEILNHGNGDLSDQGHNHLYAVSPWIEAVDGVSMGKAPLIGKNRRRLIKTHLPAQLCPYDEKARYIYVTRDPVSCFASIADFYQLMAGPLSPPRSEMLDWFLSEEMWWGPWPLHAAGWWDRSKRQDNILFLHFEEMKKDLKGIIRRVAEFLGEQLSEDEVRKVEAKSAFHYMKANEDLFEMSPPNLHSVCGTYFKSGRTDRAKDLSPEEAGRIMGYCAGALKGRAYPFSKLYTPADREKVRSLR